MSRVKDVVEELALPILNDMEMDLVDIEYVKEGKNWFLRVFIDKKDGVDIEDCGLVSEKLGTKLDETDPIPHNYFLEVSSPGAERPLKNEHDFQQAVGRNVHIRTYAPIDGERTIEGKLLEFKDSILSVEIKIKTRKKTVDIPFDKVAKARLAVSFN